MSLSVVLNGQPRIFDSLSSSSSLDLVIAGLGLKGDRVAVEHNGEIVMRTAWAATMLQDGDRLEVVHFVGGGCDSGEMRDCSRDSHRSP
jgi:sulfur carrier protein